MASISITNVSVNYTGDAFQGKVDFDLNCTPTEARLNVGFRINLAAQLNFDAIDYNNNELMEWCKKRLSAYNKYDLLNAASQVAKVIKGDINNYNVGDDVYAYLRGRNYFEFDELLEKVTPVNFYKAMVVSVWNLRVQEKVQLSNMIVAYPEQQTSSSHTVEFSVPKESLLNRRLEQMENEMRAQFLAFAGHQLDVQLSAELDWGNANTQGRCEYTVG